MLETPQARIALKELPFEQQLSALASGAIDLGFAYSAVDTPIVAADILYAHALTVAMPSDHPLSAHESLALSDVCQDLHLKPHRRDIAKRETKNPRRTRQPRKLSGQKKGSVIKLHL